jgi:hypothetical protein
MEQVSFLHSANYFSEITGRRRILPELDGSVHLLNVV